MTAALQVVAIILSACAHIASGRIEYREYPNRLAVCFNQHYKACNTQTKVGLSIFHRCMSEYQWKTGHEKEYPGRKPTAAARRYASSLATQISFRGGRNSRFRGKRQSGRYERKEYRMMSDDERRRYHRAIQVLKQPEVR